MRRNVTLAFAVVLGVLVLISGCARERSKIRMAFPPYTGDLPFFVAVDQGYFGQEGVDVEVFQTKESSEALNALLANRVDIIAPISFSALIAAEIKSPGDFRLFLPGGESDRVVGSYLLVRSGSPVNSIEDLRNKKIGTYTGATQLLYLELFLKEVGLDPEKDVTIIQVSPELQASALEAGQFDALFTIEPYSTIALQKGFARVLVENPRVKYIADPFVSGAAAVSSRVLKENPRAVKRVYKAVSRGLDFIRQNESAARDILPKYTPLEPSLAQKAGLLEWYKVDEPVDYGSIQKVADLLYDSGIVSARVEVRDLFLQKDDLE